MVTFTVRSEEEGEWLASLLTQFTGPDAGWIGLTDQGLVGAFRWMSGEPFTYSQWDTREPEISLDTGNYVGLLRSGNWKDLPGTLLYPAFVEVVPDLSPITRDDEYLSGSAVPLEVPAPGSCGCRGDQP